MATRIAAVRYISRRLSSSGKVLGEEEKAAENIYIKVPISPHFLPLVLIDLNLILCLSLFMLLIPISVPVPFGFCFFVSCCCSTF